jgi:hypothetical protein
MLEKRIFESTARAILSPNPSQLIEFTMPDVPGTLRLLR